MSIVYGNEDNFETEVLKSTETVLVDFYADWCGPCKMVAPVLDELAKESDAKIVKVNVDENPNLAAKYKVMTIPTLKVFQGGEDVRTARGAMPKEEIKKLIQG